MAKQAMGLGMPAPISGAPPQEPDDDDMGGSPGGGALSPETVKYHEGPQNCGNCQHNQGGNCDVIGEQVADEGGCDVWEGGGEQDMGGGPPPTTMPPGPAGPIR